MKTNSRIYRVYTDGSSSNNGSSNSRGGWAAIVVHPNGKEETFTGAEWSATNNQMELCAVIEALRNLPPDALYVNVISDSRYVVKGASEWIKAWSKKNFRKVKNAQMWKELLQVASRFRIKWDWVAAHNGHWYNERCDILAKDAGASLIKQWVSK